MVGMPLTRNDATDSVRLRQRRLGSLQFTIFAILLLLASTAVSAFRPSTSPRLTARSLSKIDGASALQHIVNSIEARQYIDHRRSDSLLAKILIPRVPGSPGNAKVREALLAPFRGANSAWTIEEHNFTASTPEGDKDMTNLIVTLNGDAPHKLVLAAHHDSKTIPKGFIGATDSAVPCAIIVDTALTIAKLWEEAASTRANDTALQLIFFDGEEAYHEWTDVDSVYGSRALASKWSREYYTAKKQAKVDEGPEKRRLAPGLSTMRMIDSIDHFVLLDLLGAANPHLPTHFADTKWMCEELAEVEHRLASQGLLYPRKEGKDDAFDFPPSTTIGRTPILPLPPGIASTSPKQHSFFATQSVTFGGIGDDHIPFLRNGVPILHLIASPFPRVWHTSADDASAIDWPTTYAWTMIMRVFVAEYMGLVPTVPSSQGARVTRDGATGGKANEDASRRPLDRRRDDAACEQPHPELPTRLYPGDRPARSSQPLPGGLSGR